MFFFFFFSISPLSTALLSFPFIFPPSSTSAFASPYLFHLPLFIPPSHSAFSVRSLLALLEETLLPHSSIPFLLHCLCRLSFDEWNLRVMIRQAGFLISSSAGSLIGSHTGTATLNSVQTCRATYLSPCLRHLWQEADRKQSGLWLEVELHGPDWLIWFSTCIAFLTKT